MSDAPVLAIGIESADKREAKLSLVRKLMLALKKDDEHGALDAIETLLDECDDDGDDESSESSDDGGL